MNDYLNDEALNVANYDFNGTMEGGMGESYLPDDMVANAVHNACAFFGINDAPIIANASGTCVWPGDPTTYDDDVFGLNRQQLMDLGISGEDSLTLVYTHECAHRTLQAAYNDSWEEELACDFFAGIHAGLRDMDVSNFEDALGSTIGGITHPYGALRAEFIEYGVQVAQELQNRGIEVTYDNCIEHINNHLEEKAEEIEQFRHLSESQKLAISNGEALGVTDIAWLEHQVRITSGSEQQHWLKELEWAKRHLKTT